MTADDFVCQLQAYIALVGDQMPSKLVWAVIVAKLTTVGQFPDHALPQPIHYWHIPEPCEAWENEGGCCG